MKMWVPEADHFLQEFLRREGRGDFVEISTCPQCQTIITDGDITTYRCSDCQDERLLCRACIVKNHAALPYHRVSVSLPPRLLSRLNVLTFWLVMVRIKFRKNHPQGSRPSDSARASYRATLCPPVSSLQRRLRRHRCQRCTFRWTRFLRLC